MVAIVAGSGLGLLNTSLNILGGSGVLGQSVLGQGSSRAFVNAVSGNLVLQMQDEKLAGRGLDLYAQRTYNSRGRLNDGDGDGWRWGYEQTLTFEGPGTPAQPQSGATVIRTEGDGHETTYTWNAARAAYLSTEGSGAHDELRYDSAPGEWVWTDGSTRIMERYSNSTSPSMTGRLIRRTDTSDNSILLMYDGGRLTRIQDTATQQELRLRYGLFNGLTLLQRLETRPLIEDANGHATPTLGSALRQVEYNYDNLGRLATVITDLTPADGSIADDAVFVTTYAYDDTTTRIASVTQSDGTSVFFTYDAAGKVKTVKDHSGAINTQLEFAYSAATNSTAITDGNGQAWTYQYDPTTQHLTEIITPTVNGGPLSTKFTYDARGNLVSITDARNNTITYDYDSNGNRALERDAIGNTVTRTFSTLNQMLTETRYRTPDSDGAGPQSASDPLTTRYVYDTNSRLRFVVSAEGRVTENRYGTAGVGYGLLTDALQYSGQVYNLTGLGPAQHLTEVQLTAWLAGLQDKTQVQITQNSYDLRGNMSQQTSYAAVSANGTGVLDGQASVTEYIYDAHSQLRQRAVVRGSARDQRTVTASLAYDGTGRVLTTTDAHGTQTTVYDDANRRITVTTASGLTETRSYDNRRRLVSISHTGDATTRQTRYVYNNADQLRMDEDTQRGRRYRFYDAAGRLEYSVDATGVVTRLEYNTTGQLIRKTQYLNRADTSSWYDSATQTVTKLTLTVGGANSDVLIDATHDRVTTLNYDAAGRLTASTDAASTVTTTHYDGLSRVVMTQTGDRVTRHLYDKDSRKVGIVDALGYLTEYKYDAGGRLIETVRYSHRSPAGANMAAPVWIGVTNQNAIGGQPFEYRLSAYDADGDQLTFSVVGTPPGWLSFDASTATLRGTPPTMVTSYSVTLRADDGRGKSSDVTVLIAVTNSEASGGQSGPQPTWVSLSPLEVLANMPISYVVPAASGQSLSYSVVSGLPPGLSFDPTTLTITGSPSAVGFYTILLRATNASGQSVDRTVSVQVRTTATTPGQPVGSDQLSSWRPADTNALHSYVYYDGQGRVVGSVDEQKFLTETVYDDALNTQRTLRYLTPVTVAPSDTLASLKTRGGTSLQTSFVQYDGFGRVREVTGLDGSTVTRNEYDDAGRLTRTLSAPHTTEQRARRTFYNAFGEVTATLGGEGDAWLGANPTPQRVAEAIRDYGTRHEYDTLGRKIRSLDANGNTTLLYYDRENRPTHTIYVIGRSANNTLTGEVSETNYNSFGEIESVRHYAARLADADMDALLAGGGGGFADHSLLSKLAALTNTSLDHVVSYEYDRCGRLVKQVDGENAVTTNIYNAYGEIAAQVRSLAEGRSTTKQFDYDLNGRVASQTADVGGISSNTRTTYDAFGRVTQSIDGAGKVATTAYQDSGRLIVVTDPLNRSTRTEYDALGRMLRVTNALNQQTAYAYNEAARSVTITTPEGVQLTTARTRHDETESITDGRGNVSRYSYNKDSQVTTATDALGQVIAETMYDRSGRKLRVADARGVLRRFKYDQRNRVIEHRVDPNGLNLTTRFEFDALGRQITVTEAANTLAATVTAYSYDRNGRAKTTVVDAPLGGLQLLTHYSYDDLGSIVRVARGTMSSPNQHVMLYEFDSLGRRMKEIAAPSSVFGAGEPDTRDLTTQYRYDTGGRVSRRIDANRQSTWFVYDPAGQLTHKISALGEVSESKYDSAGRLVYSRSCVNPLSASTVAAFGDAVSTFLSPMADANDQANYVVYDNDGRSRFELKASGSSGWVISENRHDANGNIIEVRGYDKFLPNARIAAIDSVSSPGITLLEIQNEIGSTLDYRDNTPNALASVRRTRFAYDANNRPRFTVDASGSIMESAYDAAGSVVRTIRFAARPTLTEYTESAINAAVDRNDHDNQITSLAYDAATRLRYTVDALGSVSEKEYDARGNVVKIVQCATRPTLTQYTESAIAAALAAAQSAGSDQVTRFVHDAGNRLRFTIDALGSVRENIYDELGNVIVATRFARRPAGFQSFTESDVNAAVNSLRSDLTNQIVHFAYGADNRLRFTVDALGSVSESVYDATGKVVETTRFAERPTLMQHTESAIAAAVAPLRANGSNQVTRFAYDAQSRLRFTVNALGSISESVYDALGKVSSTARFAARPPLTQYTESAINAAVATERNNPSNHLQHYIYDAAGQVRFGVKRVSVEAGESKYYVEKQELSAFAQPVSSISYANPVAFSAFSEAAIDAAVGSGDPSKDRVSRFVYDVAGHQIYGLQAVTWEAGERKYQVSAQQFDAFGRVVGSTNYASVVALNAFDKAAIDAAVNAVADGTKDRVSATAYDALDRLVYSVRVLSPGLHHVGNQEYDAFGRLFKTTQFETAIGPLANFDMATIETAVNAVAAVNDRKVQYVYDTEGRQRFVLQTDRTGRWTVSENRYDVIGNIVESRRYDRYVTDAWIETVGTTNLPGVSEQEMLGQLSSLGYSDSTPSSLVNLQRTRFAYDVQNQQRFTIDALGSVTENRYDALGNIVTKVRFAARPILTQYTESAINVAVNHNDTHNQVQHFTYDAVGQLRFKVQVIEPNVGSGGKHLVSEQRHDALGQLVEGRLYATALGHLTGYDELTIAAAIVPAMSDRRSVSAYDAAGRQAYTVRDLRRGWHSIQHVVTKRVYDAMSQLIQRIEFASPVLLTQFDKASIDIAVVPDLSNDRTTTYVNDAAGRLRFEIHPDLSFRESVYDALNQVTQTRQFDFTLWPQFGPTNVPRTEAEMVALRGNRAVGDGATRGLVQEHDAGGRLTSAVDALNNVERHEYNALGDRTRWIDKNGNSWTYEYDRKGQKTKETTPPIQFKLSGEALDAPASDRVLENRFRYDAFGNLIRKIEAANFANDARTTDFRFDTVGQLTSTLYPGHYDAATGRVETDPGVGRFRREASTIYDPLGKAVRTSIRTDVDAFRHTCRTYDSQGQVVHEVNALNNVTHYTYTPFGEPETVTRYSVTISGTPANGIYWTAGEVDPQLNWGYDENGNLMPDAYARTITLAYDKFGRKISATQPTAKFYSTHTPGNANHANYYRANESSVVGVQDAAVTRYEYNAFGDLILQRVRINNKIEWQDTSFTCDAIGRRTRSADAAGYVTDMVYDAVGNLMSMAEYTGNGDGNDRITAFAYNALNQQTGVDRYGLRYTDANGVDHGVAYWTWENGGTWVDPDADVATTVKTTTYDGYGRVLSITDAVGNVTSMRYNALGQLTQVTDPARLVAPINANRANAVDPFRDQVTLSPVTSITVDAFGRAVRQVRATSLSEDARETLQAYDAGGNVISITDAEGNAKLRYYDHAGRVIKETQAIDADLGPLGRNTQGLERRYGYDALGQLMDTLDVYLDGTDPMQSGQSVVYNAFGEVVEQRRKWGLASHSPAALNSAMEAWYAYDNAGHVFNKVAADGLTVYYNNLQGQVTREEKWGNSGGVDKRITETQYDVLGRAIMVRRPDFKADITPHGTGTTLRLVTPYSSRTPDRWGNVTGTEEGGYEFVNGQPVYAGWRLFRSYQHDDNNQLITESRGTHGFVSSSGISRNAQIYKHFFRDLLGSVVREVDEARDPQSEEPINSRTRLKQYNSVGQLTADIDGAHRKVECAYNVYGNRLGTRNPRGTVFFDRYDRNGNIRFHGVLRTASPSGAGEYNSFDGTGDLDRTYLNAYLHDQANRRFASVTFTEGADAPFSYTWLDGRNFGILHRNELGVVTECRYDQFGNKSVEIDGAGARKEWNATTADYVVGRIETYRYPTDSGPRFGRYTYNDFGELKVDAVGNARTEYEYHRNGLVTVVKKIPDTTAPNLVERTTYFYDARGQVTHENRADSESNQTIYISYDVQGRLARVEDQNKWPAGPMSDVRYSYDEWGNVRKVQATYTRTAAEGPEASDSWYAYDDAGRMTICNASELSGGPIRLKARTPGSAQIAYDIVGRRSETVEYVCNNSTLNPDDGATWAWDTVRDERYEYNDLGHLRKTEQRVRHVKIFRNGRRFPDEVGSWQMLASRSSNLRGDVTRAEQWRRIFGTRNSLSGVYHEAAHASTTTTVYRADGQVSSSNTVADDATKSTSILNNYNAQGQLSFYDFTGYRSNLTQYIAKFTYSYTFQNGNRVVERISDDRRGLDTIKTYDELGRLSAERIDLQKIEKDPAGNCVPNDSGSDRYEKRLYKYGAQGTIVFKDAQLLLSHNGPNTCPLPTPSTGQQAYVYAGNRTIATVGANLLAGATKFKFAYTPMSEASSSGSSRYVVQSGDTLIDIAQAVYGDGALWYIIADANGMVAAPDDPLPASEVGKAYEIRSVIRNTNSATTFKPYDVGWIIGNDRPIAIPPPPSPQWSDWEQMLVAAAQIGIQIGATVVLSAFLGPVAAGIGAGLGNLAGQGTAWGLGMQAPGQEGIDWGGVGKAAATGYAFSLAGSVGGSLAGSLGSSSSRAVLQSLGSSLSGEVLQQSMNGFDGWTSGPGLNWSGIGGSVLNVGSDLLSQRLGGPKDPDVQISHTGLYGQLNLAVIGLINSAYNPSSGWAIRASGKSPTVGMFGYAFSAVANGGYNWIRDQLERPSEHTAQNEQIDAFKGGLAEMDDRIGHFGEDIGNDPEIIKLAKRLERLEREKAAAVQEHVEHEKAVAVLQRLEREKAAALARFERRMSRQRAWLEALRASQIAASRSLQGYLDEMDELNNQHVRDLRATGTLVSVSYGVELDGLKIGGVSGVYDSQGLYAGRSTPGSIVRLDVENLREAQAIYQDALKNQSSNEPPLVDHEIILVEARHTSAEIARRTGLADVPRFDDFSKGFVKTHGSTVGVEEAYHKDRRELSKKIDANWRRTDNAFAAGNLIAKWTAHGVGFVLNPAGTASLAAGWGTEMGLRAVGVDEHTAAMFGGIVSVGMGARFDPAGTIGSAFGLGTQMGLMAAGFDEHNAVILGGIVGVGASGVIGSAASKRQQSVQGLLRAQRAARATYDAARLARQAAEFEMSKGLQIAEGVTLFKAGYEGGLAAKSANHISFDAPSGSAPPPFADDVLGVPRTKWDKLELGGFEPRSSLVANISSGSGGFTGGTIGTATPALPAINYVRRSGTRVVTVYDGEPHYRSLGQSEIYLAGSATPITKVEGDFYPFLGIQQTRAQISNVELYVADLQGGLHPRTLNTVKEPGYIIKGLYHEDGRFISRVPPSNPALRNANFRVEGDFTDPEQVNQWLMSRGAVPWIDVLHFFGQGL